ncbi:alpha/beta fold hydrolase [Nocardia sp. GCM10030253]|uniref:alpha/beta hydrolase n=1 Tax=Nocardia sp. GCM10030253 TaxID=3273404 RepID=UPI0036357953
MNALTNRRGGGAAPAIPPVGRYYNVDGRQLFLHRSGSGGPTVVFLPGASAVGLDYLSIHDKVAQWTTSVLYDRGGTGWSERVELPRTATEVATELRNLLRAAEVPAPYVLVAHSLGGAYARRFAQLFPDEVAGLVALEAFYEEWDTYMPKSLHLDKTPDAVPGRFQTALIGLLARPFYKKMFAQWPSEIRDPLVAGHVDPEWMRIGARERSTIVALADELRSGGTVPDVPIIALSALGVDSGQRLVMSEKAQRELTDSKRGLYTALADSVSHGEYRALEDAKHSTIQLDNPDEVVQAIRDVFDRAQP